MMETMNKEFGGTIAQASGANVNDEPEREVNKEGSNGTEVQIIQVPTLSYDLNEDEVKKYGEDEDFHIFLAGDESTVSQQSVTKKTKKKNKVVVLRK